MGTGGGIGLLLLNVGYNITISLLLGVVVFWTWHRTSSKDLPPGSYGWPLLGETLTYMVQMKSPLANFVDEHKKRYGKLFKSYLFFEPTVIATEVDTVRLIVQREEKKFRVNYPYSFWSLSGPLNGLNIHGEKWKQMRKFIIGMLKPELMRDRVNSIEDITLSCLSTWEGRTVYVEDEAKTLAFNLTALIVLNVPPGDFSDKIKKDYYPLIAGMFTLPIDLPWTRYGKAVRARERVVKTLDEYLASRAVKDDPYDHYLKFLRETTQDSPQFIYEQCRDFLTGLLFAGHDTTAATMVFAVKYVGDSPKVLAALRAEHENVRKSKQPGERLTWDDCKGMTFTQNVITETLRLCNVSNTVFRKAVEDVEVDGYLIPKGWCVMPYLRSIHYDPTIYSDPCKFNPWRYQEANGTKLPFFGFGGGARLCPGADLARVEICILLHHLVTKFEWEMEAADVPSFFPFPRLSKRLPIRVKPLK